MPLLLVADPDDALVEDLASALKLEGIDVAGVSDGAQALFQIGALHPNAVLVSAELPVIGPVDLIKTIRANRDLPVLLGVGDTDAEQVVQALRAGAAACVARPYRAHELLPIVSAVRPGTGPDHSTLTVGYLQIDLDAYQVRCRGELIHLPLREFQLLHFLMRHADKTVTRQQIMRQVWQSHHFTGGSTNTLAVHVKRLRQRLGDHNDKLIQTVRSVGYRLVTPPADAAGREEGS
jgi:DNA-binding response OmpR family regulator